MRSIAVVVLMFVALSSAGCGGGSDSVADDTYKGLPPGADASSVREQPLSGKPLLTWVKGNTAFAVTTWGSSSCPAVPRKMESSTTSIEIRFSASDKKTCTADLAPTTHEFLVPDAVTADPEITARFGSGASEESYSLS